MLTAADEREDSLDLMATSESSLAYMISSTSTEGISPLILCQEV